MRIRIDPDQFVPIAAIALMVLSMAACAFQLGNDDDGGAITSPVSEQLDPFAAKLRHCRTVTSEQAADLEACRQVWVENRRRFLTSTKPIDPAPGSKYPDRIVPPVLNNQQGETR